MKKKLSSFERQLMLDEILFYSICSEDDRRRILDQQLMTFQDFRRLSLITDYLELDHLHKFIWDLHGHKFMDEMDKLYQKCKDGKADLSEMLLETGQWLDAQHHSFLPAPGNLFRWIKKRKKEKQHNQLPIFKSREIYAIMDDTAN